MANGVVGLSRKAVCWWSEVGRGPVSRHITMSDRNRDLLLVYFTNNSFFGKELFDTNRTKDRIGCRFCTNFATVSLL